MEKYKLVAILEMLVIIVLVVLSMIMSAKIESMHVQDESTKQNGFQLAF